ncbi:MAG: prolyl oligopeptidase [Candidatus Omnitrophota bacterium]|jgi:prolyl oligopeptidase
MLPRALAWMFLLNLIWLTSCQTTLPVAPESRRSDTVLEIHGDHIPDPYDWLEDMDSPETQRWIDAQNRVTQRYLRTIPTREALNHRLTELWDYTKYGTPWKAGDRYFMSINNGLQNHPVLHTMRYLGEEPRVLLDPNRFSRDGTTAVSGTYTSPDGRWLAYAVSESGSDWKKMYVRNVDSSSDLDDVIDWVKFSGAAWDHESKGFYYARYPDQDLAQKFSGSNTLPKLFYHRLGQPQEEDRLIYHRPDHPTWGYSPNATRDGRYLIIHVWQGSSTWNGLFYIDLDDPSGRVVEMLNQFDSRYSYLHHEGPVFFFSTDANAPRGRVIAIHKDHPQRENWKEIIPEQAETLMDTSYLSGRFVCQYLQDAKSLVRVYDLKGTYLRDVPLPGIGSVKGFNGEPTDRETFYRFSSFTTPTETYRYDVVTGHSRPFFKPTVQFDPTLYETRQVFYPSRDGTRIPMFISHRKGLPLNGNNPTMLYGYGGFNISQTPRFSLTRLAWMEMGGVYAVANIRGGGEYGEAWHDAGRKLNKQNVFDDFIAAAEHLIASGYTSPQKLAIDGRSNGGLLVAACMLQRPELFAAALPGVGVLDMLKYHTFTIGWAWASDYGTIADPAEYRALRAYSPYHNITPGARYPSTLVTTADTDDRVIPAHSYKFTAALQAANASEHPILIRVDRKAGHGSGKPTGKMIAEIADRLAFAWKALGMIEEPDVAQVEAPEREPKGLRSQL